uniref:Nedd4 family interacting protein 2 n=1 Tax=Leptobrachium leishanense TaxID=445787 RepID=A0A8C5LKX0_9ANUR
MLSLVSMTTSSGSVSPTSESWLRLPRGGALRLLVEYGRRGITGRVNPTQKQEAQAQTERKGGHRGDTGLEKGCCARRGLGNTASRTKRETGAGAPPREQNAIPNNHGSPSACQPIPSETQNDFYPVPPPYSVATTLPTYDEAEKAKAAAMAAAAADAAQREEEYPPRDDFSDADQLRVGNDGIFMLSFFMAFIFNWIGFCLSFCITNTIAGRYGAICGFGLSLIKWILIVRFSDYFTGYFNGQYWLWWIFFVLGLLLFFRGFVNYLKVRNMSESMAAAHRTRFFFLY